MDIGIQIEVIYKDKDLIELRASAWNGAFGGKTDLYLDNGRLEEIAENLKGFPKQPSDTREVILGAFGPEWAGGGMSMRFFCTDGSGHAYVESKIESGNQPQGAVQSASLTLPIEAASVDLFVEELRQLGVRKQGKAQLQGVLSQSNT